MCYMFGEFSIIALVYFVIWLFWWLSGEWLDVPCGPDQIHVMDLIKYMLWTWSNTCYEPDQIHVMDLIKYMLWAWSNTCYGPDQICYWPDQIHVMDLIKYMLWTWSNVCYWPDQIHVMDLIKYMLWTWSNTCYVMLIYQNSSTKLQDNRSIHWTQWQTIRKTRSNCLFNTNTMH